MKKSDFYVLYSHNIAVRGRDKAAIYNLHKGSLIFAPNSMIDIIESLKTRNLEGVEKELQSEEDKKLFLKYIEFMERHCLGMFVENPDRFPPMKKKWMIPADILTAIIEYDCINSRYNIIKLLKQLDSLFCNFLELRFINIKLDKLKEILSAISRMGIRSINLILEYQNNLEYYLQDIYDTNEKIECILTYDSPKSLEENYSHPSIKFTSLLLDDEKICIQKDQYTINTKYFMEAQEFHPYFNKKLVVDRNGNIKNDLSFKKTFGSVESTTLVKILQNTDFTEIWYASPDKVIDYKDDPLRYCKIYTDNLKKIGDFYTID